MKDAAVQHFQNPDAGNSRRGNDEVCPNEHTSPATTKSTAAAIAAAAAAAAARAAAARAARKPKQPERPLPLGRRRRHRRRNATGKSPHAGTAPVPGQAASGHSKDRRETG